MDSGSSGYPICFPKIKTHLMEKNYDYLLAAS
jgi:hypothetical protein